MHAVEVDQARRAPCGLGLPVRGFFEAHDVRTRSLRF
jgi:hypothetical protein